MNDVFFDDKQAVGFQKTTLIDYPGRLAAIIFFPFCNMRCPWCHNGDLILGRKRANGTGLVPLIEAVSHIKKRREVLGGVVLSGGEAALYPSLPELVSYIKRLGLAVKLDTNGSAPGVLEKLLSSRETRPDYIAMDLKIAPGRYAELLTKAADAKNPLKNAIAGLIERSAAIVRASGVEHEFRSLRLSPPYFTEADVEALRPLAGNSVWNFRHPALKNCLDPSWNRQGDTD
ncbi:MAG: anaerobic ribonucleoside-triphosphate reductase activating protein [Spirochaetaceae bacterium]|nr:anaerobic ribonucleoside-triphosphate reductase activating protein [Spirochaetaceae bacterium]